MTTATKPWFATGIWYLGQISLFEEHGSYHSCENPCEFSQHVSPSYSADTFQSLKKTAEVNETSLTEAKLTSA